MKTDKETLGIAIVGAGYWGRNYVRLFNELADTHVAAVCDLDPEQLAVVRKQYPAIDVSQDLDAVLADPAVDAVAICTPATAHYDVTRRALLAGKPALVEKPLATSSEQAMKLVDLADSRHLMLMVGHIFMYNAGVRAVKSYIDRSLAGTLYYLYARRTNLGPIRRDVSALWDLAPHDVSVFNYLLGRKPEWVSAVGARVLGSYREDVSFIALGYPDNVMGHIHVSWAEPNKVRETVLVSSEQRIVFNDLDPLEQVRIFEKGIAPTSADEEPSNFGEFKYAVRDGDIISPRIEVSEPLKDEVKHFVQCVKNGEAPLSDGWNGFEVVKIVEAAGRSMLQRGAPVELSWQKSAQATADRLREIQGDYRPVAGSIH